MTQISNLFLPLCENHRGVLSNFHCVTSFFKANWPKFQISYFCLYVNFTEECFLIFIALQALFQSKLTQISYFCLYVNHKEGLFLIFISLWALFQSQLNQISNFLFLPLCKSHKGVIYNFHWIMSSFSKQINPNFIVLISASM